MNLFDGKVDAENPQSVKAVPKIKRQLLPIQSVDVVAQEKSTSAEKCSVPKPKNKRKSKQKKTSDFVFY